MGTLLPYLVQSICLVFGLVSGSNDWPPNVLSGASQEMFYRSGDSLTLLCRVSGGHPQPEVEWIKDGLPVDLRSGRASVLPSGALFIERTTMFDTGTYHCRASNTYGVAVGGMAFVVQASLGAFRPHPIESRHVSPRQSLKLRCEPTDSFPPARVYWRTGDNDEASVPLNTESNDRITTDEYGNLYFTSVLPEDQARDLYRCAMYNPILDIETAGSRQYIVINQQDPPRYVAPHLLWHSGEEVVGFRGEELNLKCIVGGYPTPHITWTGPNNYLEVGDNQRELMIRLLTKRDEGVYVCSAGDGAVMVRFNVTVHVKPHWTAHLESNITVPLGEDLTVVCPADGVPAVAIEWFFNGITIKTMASNPRLSVTHDRRTLTLRDVTTNDMCVIQCYARNIDGFVFKNFAVKVVAIPPEIEEHLSRITTVLAGDTTLLTCRASGAPRPDITWSTREGILQPDERRQVLRSGGLKIKNVGPEDAGWYQCAANNSLGTATVTGELEVQSRPASLTTTTTEAPTVSHVVLNFRFVRFSNPDGKGANGHCCDGKWSICQSGDGCDHRFNICLDSVDGPENDDDECSYWRKRSGKIRNENDITFGESFGGLDNEFTQELTVSFEEHMPNVAQLKVAVWDEDRWSGDDFVDFLRTNLVITEGDVVTKDPWSVTLQPRTRLDLELWVTCAPDYYGERCDRHCVHPSGPEDGGYFCDPDTGEIICLPGFSGAECRERR